MATEGGRGEARARCVRIHPIDTEGVSLGAPPLVHPRKKPGSPLAWFCRARRGAAWQDLLYRLARPAPVSLQIEPMAVSLSATSRFPPKKPVSPCGKVPILGGEDRCNCGLGNEGDRLVLSLGKLGQLRHDDGFEIDREGLFIAHLTCQGSRRDRARLGVLQPEVFDRSPWLRSFRHRVRRRNLRSPNRTSVHQTRWFEISPKAASP
jgi:hypothetical protein